MCGLSCGELTGLKQVEIKELTVPPKNNSDERREFSRRKFIGSAAMLGATAVAPVEFARTSAARTQSEVKPFELDEVTVAELQEGMKSGKFTAHAIAQKYLDRIEAIDKRGPAINSVIETNPDARSIADSLDEERKSKGSRGPLHGIPVLIKDNIGTAD